MLVLLVKLCKTFEIEDRCEYDNWTDFLTLLNEVTVLERHFILDLLSVSAAFDANYRAWNVIICPRPSANTLKFICSVSKNLNKHC
jgi:hypothetical protein